MIPRLKRFGFVLAACLSLAGLTGASLHSPRPRLVVVISIDQFRADYLDRFRRYFSQNGFNLLLREGANFAEAQYEHSVTQTCPGHAVILTGSYANVNGIVANTWYNPALRRAEYCAADTSAKLIGVNAEGRSPRNLLDSTVGDELKRETSGRSRVIAIAGKDRSAIMMAGHLADAAYWTEDTLIVTSSYYMKELPQYVQTFNAQGAITRYRGATWDHFLPARTYALAGPDNVAAEEDVGGMGRVFPHHLSSNPARSESFLEGFSASPFENEVLVDFAIQVIRAEQLGGDDDPDVLALGFSANDVVGHSYGPDSHEVMDMTIRTDRLLERFFTFLIQQVGRENLVIALTSDHGVAPLPEVERRRRPQSSAARLDPAVIAAATEKALRARYGIPRAPAWLDRPTWIMQAGWPSLYLNLPALEDRNVPLEEAEAVAKRAIQGVPGVAQVLTGAELDEQRARGAHSRSELSYYPGRSGQLFYVLAPYVLPESQPQGTTHGSPWAYDTHVPLLLFGSGVTSGRYSAAAAVADLAPTLSALLGISAPGGSQGRVLKEALH
jgi:predicted AlkP superfamily pyrophosphatase or phosphodiesterase